MPSSLQTYCQPPICNQVNKDLTCSDKFVGVMTCWLEAQGSVRTASEKVQISVEPQIFTWYIHFLQSVHNHSQLLVQCIY